MLQNPTMSTIQPTTSELQYQLENQSAPQPTQNINFHDLASQQVSQVPGLDPSQTHMATFLASLQIKAEHEAKVARHLLEKSLMNTIQTVNTNSKDISNLKQTVVNIQSRQDRVENNQTDIYAQLHQIHSLAWRSYVMAAENKQRGSKGNFIVQGDHVPTFSPNEDLYAKIFPIIQEKYGIYVHPNELKALHRLPNGKILFSLASRLPGQNFDQFTRQMNFNPKPHIKVFVSIQLFEPYSELHYVARRLKNYKVISNYRLDENGNTQIALSPTTQSFKFTGLDQLQALQISVPPQIKDEISYRRSQIQQNEEKSQKENNEKSHKQRPGPPPSRSLPAKSNSQLNHPGPTPNRPLLTGANTTPVIPRVPAPLQTSLHPGSVTTDTQYQSHRNVSHHAYQDSRSKSVKRPHSINPSPTYMTPGQVKFNPPPSQQYYPQSSYPPYPPTVLLDNPTTRRWAKYCMVYRHECTTVSRVNQHEYRADRVNRNEDSSSRVNRLSSTAASRSLRSVI